MAVTMEIEMLKIDPSHDPSILPMGTGKRGHVFESEQENVVHR